MVGFSSGFERSSTRSPLLSCSRLFHNFYFWDYPSVHNVQRTDWSVFIFSWCRFYALILLSYICIRYGLCMCIDVYINIYRLKPLIFNSKLFRNSIKQLNDFSQLCPYIYSQFTIIYVYLTLATLYAYILYRHHWI